MNICVKTDLCLKSAAMKEIKNIGEKLAVIPLLGLLYAVMYFMDTTCIVKSIVGYPCPGCGMTRALISALHLDFSSAFALHPMFWSVPVLVLYFLYDGRPINNKKLNYGILIAIGTGFLFNWIARLIEFV